MNKLFDKEKAERQWNHIQRDLQRTDKKTLLRHFLIGFLPVLLLALSVGYADRQVHECTITLTNNLGYNITIGPLSMTDTNDWLRTNEADARETGVYLYQGQTINRREARCLYNFQRWRCINPLEEC